MYASEDSTRQETGNAEDLARRVRLSVDRSHQHGLRLIGIEVVGDTVVLSGHVVTFHLKQLATAFARRVAGVVEVSNRLEVHDGRNDDVRGKPM
jgi:osmotically-inducible protein OsmY